MAAKFTPVPTALERHISTRTRRSRRCIGQDRQPAKPTKRRISISELPLLGSLNRDLTDTINLESLHPKLKKVAQKMAKRAWKGAKVSAMLLLIAPYLPVVLFFILWDWAQRELAEHLSKEKDGGDSPSDWSTTSTLLDWEEDSQG